MHRGHGTLIPMTFAEKITVLCKRKKLDLMKVAEESGINYNTLRSYLRPGSNRKPSVDRGITLAQALGVPTDWLFDDEQEMPPPVRVSPPPFQVEPWPNDGISWAEVQLALSKYSLEKITDLSLQISEEIDKVGFTSETRSKLNTFMFLWNSIRLTYESDDASTQIARDFINEHLKDGALEHFNKMLNTYVGILKKMHEGA